MNLALATEPGWTPDTGGAHRVPVAEFTAAVRPPGFGELYRDLGDMVAKLLEWPREAAVIADLVTELRRDGRFRSHIRVEDGELANGCHRYTAAVVAGVEHVDVWVVDADHPDPEWTDGAPIVELTYHLDGGGLAPDDVDDLFFDVASSFPLDTDTWAAGDGLGRSGDEYYTCLYLDACHARAANDAVIARLAAHGITARHVRTLTYASDDVPDDANG